MEGGKKHSGMHLKIIDNLQAYDEEAVVRLIDELPAWRREVALKFRFLEGRRESALAYHTLCQLLREDFGVDFQPTFVLAEHGKPSLAELPQLHFSLSHCKDAIGCIIDTYPCGIDVESIRPTKESLIRYTMNDEEVAQILAAEDSDAAFTRLWTRKEAVGKLRGVGIGEDLHQMLAPERIDDIELHTEMCEKYAISVATMK